MFLNFLKDVLTLIYVYSSNSFQFKSFEAWCVTHYFQLQNLQMFSDRICTCFLWKTQNIILSLSSRRRNNMKFLVGLFIARFLVSESDGRLRRRIFRKCQQSGVTFPTCESGEWLWYFRNTCDEVVGGNFGKFRFFWFFLGSYRCLQVPPGDISCH